MSEQQTSEDYNPFQKPKFKALERLVCSHLIESINATKLESIIHMCRAAQLLPEAELERLNLDIEKINRVYTVAERLEAGGHGDDGGRYATHSVSLSGLDFEEYIYPWLKRKRLYSHWQHGVPEIEPDMDYVDILPQISQGLSPRGYHAMVSDFVQFAMPFAQLLGGILTDLISPETYTNMLLVYKGGRHDTN